ncbi:YihY/virulence factor BrkB family protein [Cellulomonas soli]|uniref:YihY/virulence factor BrkB family protein n=1 Tax=Cellulomonas soli TaxID=931535 RepID=UPI003F8778E0
MDRTDAGPDAAAQEPAGAGAAQWHAEVSERGARPAGPSLPTRSAAWVRGRIAWWKGSRPGRANARFGAVGGGVLAGGIAYATLFSLSAGLTLGWTVFMRVLGGNEQLRVTVIETVDDALPGLFDTGDGNGLLAPDDLVFSPGLTMAGAVALVVLVVSATSAMAAMRKGVRAVFGATTDAENAVVGKLRDLGGLVAFAVVVLVSAVLSQALTGTSQWVLGLLGIDDTGGALLVASGAAVSFVLDAAVFVLVVTVLAGARPARRDLVLGAVMAAAGLGAVRLLGTSVVAGSVTGNALLGSFAVLVTLLAWINLVARMVLLAAAWTADPPGPEGPEGVADAHEPVPPRG